MTPFLTRREDSHLDRSPERRPGPLRVQLSAKTAWAFVVHAAAQSEVGVKKCVKKIRNRKELVS